MPREGKIVLELKAAPRMLPFYECGVRCACNATGRCINRVTQRGVSHVTRLHCLTPFADFSRTIE